LDGAGTVPQAGLGLLATLGPGLRAGLAYGSLSDERLSPFSEQSLAGVVSLDPTRDQSLGLRVTGHQLSSDYGPSVQGLSLDLGWRWQGAALPGVPGRFTLGLAADHVAGAWPDEDWARAAPSDLRTGLAWRPLSALWLGVEERWSVDATQLSGGQRELRLGADWAPWRPGWALRAGWRDADNGEASAGLGLPLPWGLRADYALLIATGGQSSLVQRLALAWSFERPGEELISVRPSQVLTDPDTGQVERASFKVGLDPVLQATRWRLELRDSDDHLRRTLGPFDPLEGSADWDGRDEQGEPVAEGKRVSYTLVVESPRGTLRKSSALDLAQAWDEAPAAKSRGGLPAPRLKPVLAPDGAALQQVAMELPEEPASSWMLTLRGSSGEALRKFSGLGRPPKELVWDGRDQKGVSVADPLGVAVEFQLRGEDGLPRSSEQPLFSQEAFALAQHQAKELPQLNLAPLGLPLVSGREWLSPSAGTLAGLLASASHAQGTLAQTLRLRQAEALRSAYLQSRPGGAVDLALFDLGQSEPREDRLALLDALPVPKGRGRVQLQGLAREDEGDAAGLARRRAFAVAQHLRGRLSQGQAFVLADGAASAERPGLRAQLRSGEEGKDWDSLSASQRVQALTAAGPSQLRARYDMAEEGGDPSDLADHPIAAQDRARLLQRWGVPAEGLLTQWHPGIGKAVLFRQGCLWVSDKDGTVLRSLWYDPDLNAAGQIRFSEDGSRLWLRADGWRRWVCLRLEAEGTGEQALGK
jgi:hypothetical protein